MLHGTSLPGIVGDFDFLAVDLKRDHLFVAAEEGAPHYRGLSSQHRQALPERPGRHPLQGGVTFLVSGGGAASPVEVEHAPDDLYQDKSYPNYHFVEFVLDGATLEGKMYRLVNPEAETIMWEVKDTFSLQSRDLNSSAPKRPVGS